MITDLPITDLPMIRHFQSVSATEPVGGPIVVAGSDLSSHVPNFGWFA